MQQTPPISGVDDTQLEQQPDDSPYPGVVPGILPPYSVKDMAYGGNDGAGLIRAQQGQLRRVERSTPRMRRGRLLPTIPRTKAETVYVRDSAQTLQNVVLNKAVAGVGSSGIPVLGTTTKPASTGAVNRYLDQSLTLLQP